MTGHSLGFRLGNLDVYAEWDNSNRMETVPEVTRDEEGCYFNWLKLRVLACLWGRQSKTVEQRDLE